MNFGGDHLFGDITAVATEDLPHHDVLTAGFPCQPFARRGERLGFEDSRGELFHEIPRVLQARRPAGFLLENVWNMQFLGEGQWDKDEDKWVYGHVFKTVIECLQNVGYVVKTKTISAHGWVPQKRQRVYLVGFRDDLAESALRKFEWPSPPGGGTVKDVLEARSSEEAQSCELTEVQWAAVQKSSTWLSGGSRLRFVDLDGVASTLTGSYLSSYASTAEMVAPSETGLQRPRFFYPTRMRSPNGFPRGARLGKPPWAEPRLSPIGQRCLPPIDTSSGKESAAKPRVARKCGE